MMMRQKELKDCVEESVVGRERAVSDGVDPHLQELLLQVRIPQVLDFVVGSPWKMPCNRRPPEHTRTSSTNQGLNFDK